MVNFMSVLARVISPGSGPVCVWLIDEDLHPTPGLRSLGFLLALLGDHVQLGDPVLVHRQWKGDPVFLDQHTGSFLDVFSSHFYYNSVKVEILFLSHVF